MLFILSPMHQVNQFQREYGNLGLTDSVGEFEYPKDRGSKTMNGNLGDHGLIHYVVIHNESHPSNLMSMEKHNIDTIKAFCDQVKILHFQSHHVFLYCNFKLQDRTVEVPESSMLSIPSDTFKNPIEVFVYRMYSKES